MGVEIEEEVIEPETAEVETEIDGSEEEDEIREDENTSDEDNNEEDETDAEEGELTVTIGDEEPQTSEEDEQEEAPGWVKELRKSHKELQRENRELKKKMEAEAEKEVEKEVTLPPKPTLESVDYDSDIYEAKLEDWYELKRKHDAQQAERKQAEEAEQKAWQDRLNNYAEGKKKLNVRDYDDAEFVVQETFSETQQAMMLQGSDNPNLLVYALGKNPKKAKDLSSINDPVKFAFAVAKLEATLKVGSRKAPPPEKKVTGTGKMSGSVDSTLERLREEAQRTGDYSKVTAYKRQKRQ